MKSNHKYPNLIENQDRTLSEVLGNSIFYHIFYPPGKSERLHLLRYQCIAVGPYSFSIDALKLKP